jgi:hypothetical protein
MKDISDNVKVCSSVCKHPKVYIRGMTPQRILNGILGVLLVYNASFFALHLTGQSRLWKDALNDLQSLLSILELIAVVALFVDLVIRFDRIAKAWQVPRVIGVGLCVTGLLFKWFVLYLHLSYLVD